MKYLLSVTLSIVFLNFVQAQCTTGCDRIDPPIANLSVLPDEVVCITASNVVGTVQIGRGFKGIGQLGGELRVCGSSTTLTATSSFSIYGDDGFYNGGVVKLFNCATLNVTGSFSDNYDAGIQAYCNDCGTADYTINDAVTVTGAKILTGWECTQVLPVELTAFDLFKSGNNVSLIWKTSSEINNDFFEVESSNDGNSWASIGVVQGAGNSNVENTYSFYDDSKKGNVVYYRLKQTDYDGTTDYSEVKVVRFNNSDYLTVYKSGNDLKVELDANGGTTVHVFDMNGKMVKATQFYNAADNGKTLLTFDAGQLSAGVYSVNVYTGGSFSTKKFIVTN